jgi:hypothetical protein
MGLRFIRRVSTHSRPARASARAAWVFRSAVAGFGTQSALGQARLADTKRCAKRSDSKPPSLSPPAPSRHIVSNRFSRASRAALRCVFIPRAHRSGPDNLSATGSHRGNGLLDIAVAKLSRVVNALNGLCPLRQMVQFVQNRAGWVAQS